MQIFWRSQSPLGNHDIEDQLRTDIEKALLAIYTCGDEFVVNDTLWFWQNPKGKIMPTVVNSAKFITGRFQEFLQNNLSWQAEKLLDSQEVDGYKEFSGDFNVFILEEDNFLKLLNAYEVHYGSSSGPIASAIYMQHCLKVSPVLSEDLIPLQHFFHQVRQKIVLRVAVEFETGNIASSFRAANKLEQLYRQDLIDLGIFITSEDKRNCAARIWPVSNRNGSFQELERRRFAQGLTVPLWLAGFLPDRFDQSAPYLADDGTTYMMTPSQEIEQIGTRRYAVFRDIGGQKRLKPLP